MGAPTTPEENHIEMDKVVKEPDAVNLSKVEHDTEPDVMAENAVVPSQDDDMEQEMNNCELKPVDDSNEDETREENPVANNDEMDETLNDTVTAPLTGKNSDVEAGEEKSLKVNVGEIIRRRELWWLIIGTIMFLLGLIMLIIGVTTIQTACGQHGKRLNGNSYYDFSDNLNEPYAYNETGNEVNLALSMPAWQSSTNQENPLVGNASLTTDGIAYNQLSKGHCTQTVFETRPKWTVDLRNVVLVKRIQIVKAVDCCGGEMFNFEVRVGENQDDAEMNSLCKHYMGTALSATINIVCERPLMGRYVSIELLGDANRPKGGRLTLCEVMVFGQSTKDL